MALMKQWDGAAWVEVAAQEGVPSIQDTPVDGATTAGISSNWAYDHTADPSAHAPVSGQSDIDDALADTDDILVYDATASAHKKSALSRVWTYIASKLTAYTGDITAKSFSLNQNISQAAWTTNGVRHKNTAVTLTDTSSSGTVAAAYTDVFGGNTIAASNTTTYTDYATSYIAPPVAGTNVTLTNRWAKIFGGPVRVKGLGTTTGTVIETQDSNGLRKVRILDSGTIHTHNLYTDASNYERAKIEWSSNVLNIGTEKAGTGTARALALQTDGTTQVSIGTTGAVACTSTLSATTLTATATTANTSAIAASSYSLTGSSAVSAIDVSGTWNTTGAPTLCKYNVTDTASNAASLLVDYQVGSVSQYRVRKDGALSAKRVVTAVTTTASPTNADSYTVYTNEGDADGATITLPTAAAGLQYTFVVQTAQTLTITANTGDTIRVGSSVTAAAGSISSAVVGSTITLQAINATEWVALSTVGSWSI